ncbi:MAG: Omp28-related outer membrane protein [Rikenellaceae bacterium]
MLNSTTKLFVLILLLLAGGCNKETLTPNHEETPDVETQLEIIASLRSVSINDSQEVEFSVFCGDNDVTELSTIYKFEEGRSTKLASNNFIISHEGENLFYALYEGVLTAKVAVIGVVDPLLLSAESNYVALESDAPLQFRVECRGVDITESTTLYAVEDHNGGRPMDGHSLTFDSIGEYNFYAIYNDIPSNEITIRVLNKILEPLPDPEPSKYDSFKRRVLAIHMADAGCSPCVDMVRLVHSYLKTPLGEEIVFSAAHGPLQTVDPMTCLASTTVIAGLEVKMFPALSFALTADANFVLSSADSSVEKNYDKVDAIMESLLSTEVKSSIAASSTLSDGVISVRADVKIASDGRYGIGIWLLEDGLYHPQAGAAPEELEELSIHNGVIRDIYPFSKALTIDLGGFSSHKAGTRYECCCDFPLSEIQQYENIDNCRLLIFVYDHSTAFTDNAITLKLGESCGYEYIDD